MHWKVLITSLALAASTFTDANAQSSGKRPFTFEDMMALKRVSDPVPSPNGKWVVFSAVEVDIEENTRKSRLWIVPATGGEARRLNPTENEEERARFSPDGNRLIFSSKATDPAQIWICDFDSNAGALAGQPQQLTTISTGAEGGIWSPDGRNVLFVSKVYPDCKDDACNKQRDEELTNSKVKAKTFDSLLYRHWNAFTEFKRSHLFLQPADGSAPPSDMTPGDHDVPPFNLGGQDMYAVSPDGQELAYTSNIDEVEATSTNNEIFIVQLAGGAPKKISSAAGSDATPVYSPDGKHLAWLSMARGGFEADKARLFIYERQSGQTRDATQEFDRSVGGLAWAPDSSAIFFTAEDRGEAPIYALPLEAKKPVEIARLHADELAFGPDGKNLFFARASITAPNEIWRMDVSGAAADAAKRQPEAVTRMNEPVLSQIAMQPLESFTFKGGANADVQGFIVKPPNFDAAKKYPVKFLIHGGPQGAWGNSWTYRWNAQLFAASGDYVVVMINPHGSTGYGQAFTDAVSGDWGGKPYDDLMKGFDHVVKTYPFIDKTRVAAMGASYGGYMVNWILGHTDRFKCAVSHASAFNAESFWGTTEELWFAEWEFGGPPWKSREIYRRWSPHLHAEKFKTPTLVVHGQLDYRLDVSQGFELFTTLQRLKVPSKLLYFPDEGHWVNKPQNSRLWYKTVNEWVDQWCGADRKL
ncbi:MAG: Dipeptidyl aminopeptidases/acylaminoacyl-peptidases [uncultured Chthoniobacterales bacterium]|uniref:Dipeptidyl aminopeptidases/acylaminoacyl-peptidases n=1 Tax=uncultured Chthoniobacterales bacterium TaxID=1836801 RepID=A0A6J4IU99_9BACT|nr:MAG: Dipeptidyl aminopeptidases/acylaminoacyl-peptidases [uncultured Chthoniobacterales bacterium]